MSLRYLTLCILVFVGTGLGCTEQEPKSNTTSSDSEWITLFDGESTTGWDMTGPGAFRRNADGSITAEGGMGLYYFKDVQFNDFILELEWKSPSATANSGVFVRFPAAPDPWYVVNTGYEIQIDDSRDPLHRTGSIFGMAASSHVPSKPLGEWNQFRIEVMGQRYVVYLNGERINDFTGDRGLAGMVGLQNHDDNSAVSFRNIRVLPLPTTATTTLVPAGADQNGPDQHAPESIGEEIYRTRCVSCHMPDGAGVQGLNPPLARSTYVNGDKGQLIRIVLNGLHGERTIDSVTYNGVMPPWSRLLDDAQLAALLTYVRVNFGNEAEAISEEEVVRVRSWVADRATPWTVEELSREENRGIPTSSTH